MTDLDRQIAKIKGWVRPPQDIDEPFESGDILYSPDGKCMYVEGQESPMWSMDDAKAFELVDEWCALEKGNRVWVSIGEFDSFAQFGREYHPMAGGIQVSREFTATRPEAICRAYIAAMEWAKDRKP